MKYNFLPCKGLLKIFCASTILLLNTSTGFADDYSEEIDQFLVDITINQDNSVTVTEEILYDFGLNERRGIIREIPTTYGSGGHITTNIEVLSVTDENNNDHPYQVNDYYYKEIKIGDPNIYITGPHWYKITYTFAPAIAGYESYDELAWDVTGNGWSVPINNAEATLHLPEPIAQQATCYTGYYGSTNKNCSAEIIDQSTFKFSASNLSSYEGLSVGASFDKGLVDPITTLTIESTPSAEAYLSSPENEWHYYLPVTIHATEDEYEITVKKYKYITQSKTISIKKGQNNLVQFELEEAAWVPYVETYIPLAILFGGLFFLYRLWRKYGDDPQGRSSIAPMVTPPDKLTPGEIGVIVDQKAHLHDITSTIIYLATEGYLKIKREEKKGLFGKAKYSFIKVKEPKVSNSVPKYAKTIFDAIFSDKKKKEVKLSDLSNKFYKNLSTIKKELYQELIDKGYYEKSPTKVRTLYFVCGIIMLFAGNFIGVALAIATGSFLYGTAFFLISILTMIMSIWMPRRTVKGMAAYDHIKGLGMYLKTAEKDRFAQLHSPEQFKEHFEKLLPYAIALSVEEKWAKQFKDYLKSNPDWYQSSGPFDFHTFSNSLNSFTRSATSTIVSRPSSSGSSSYSGWSGGSSSFSSGGGFSGGGFGGGGGSSW